MSCSKTSKPDSKPASSIRPDIFQGLITRHLQGTREYKSVDSKVVEMTGSDVGSPTPAVCGNRDVDMNRADEMKDDLSTVRSFVVKVNEMRRWLENDVSGGEKGGGDNKTRLRVM
jgi:hypothetical protein